MVARLPQAQGLGPALDQGRAIGQRAKAVRKRSNVPSRGMSFSRASKAFGRIIRPVCENCGIYCDTWYVRLFVGPSDLSKADVQDTHHTVSAGVPYIIDTSLHLFLLNIIRSPRHPIHSHLMHTLLSQIQLERDGETIPRSTVRECVDILLRLSTIPPTAPSSNTAGNYGGGGSSANASRTAAMTAAAAAAGNSAHTVYAVEFEPRFMATSAEFYADEAEEGVERGDAAGFLRNVSLLAS